MAKTPEQRLESRQIREMRRQIIRLRRIIAQMRKRNSRIENDFAEFREELAYESLDDETAPEIQQSEDAIPCPKCSSTDVKILELRGMPYYRCHSCDSKGKLPQQK